VEGAGEVGGEPDGDAGGEPTDGLTIGGPPGGLGDEPLVDEPFSDEPFGDEPLVDEPAGLGPFVDAGRTA
jgi:hypothetical protein